MIIIIQPHELLGKFKNEPAKIDRMYNLGIDYATHTLDCVFEDEYVTVFNFKDYAIITDNRWNTYEISKGMAGILIEIVTTKEQSL